MAQDPSRHDAIRYDLLVQEALRDVVRGVLADTAKNGLPGEHHFYVTFNTRLPGVKLSNRMLSKYPESMKIVLQHVFWDLAVNDDYFEVGLSFGGQGEKLTVPFSAITAFYDPSVEFGLRFETQGALPAENSSDAAPPKQEQDIEGPADEHAPSRPAVARLEAKMRGKAALEKADAQAGAGKDTTLGKAKDQGADKDRAKVVSIDSFRKKT